MKCPCENCLLLPICKNRCEFEAINLIRSVNQCCLLQDFLKAKPEKVDTHFDTNLPRQEFKNRLNQVNNYLPLGTLKILR